MKNLFFCILVSITFLSFNYVYAKSVSGSVEVSYNKEKVIIKYYETSYSKNRGINVSNGKRSFEYSFDPNPHNDPWYNKNQGKFYHIAASEIGMLYLSSKNHLFPRYEKKITVHKIDYKLSKR